MKEQTSKIKVYKPTVKDRRHCAKCKYHTYIGGLTCCLYILDKGEPRGCQFGVKCDKFEKGKINKRSQIYSVIDPQVKVTRDKEYKQRNEMIAYKGDALKRMRIKE